MIKLNKITKKFGSKALFKDFSYSFNEGQSYALIGNSGSGKTTLLNIIGKLENPNSGEVTISGLNIAKIPDRKYYRDYIGYLFQNYGLIDNETILQNLELAFVGKKLAKSDRHKKMLDALNQVNLKIDTKRKIYSLSGGEAQRVAIAKLILKNPPIILADEPTASLDIDNSKEVIDLILSLQNDAKIIIIATHNPNIWRKVDAVIDINS